MNKKKIAASIFVIALLFIAALRYEKKQPAAAPETAKPPLKVSVQSAADSKALLQKNQFPATVVGEQEVKVTAKSAGTVIVAPSNIGRKVGIGTLLAQIDDTGTLDIGDQGLRSLQVQQAELSAEQAKKSYSLAKDNYNNLKKASLATEAQKDSAKTQRDIAKLQYENALLGLNGSVDNHLMTSPITGVITNKAVSVGDSVSVGQLIATVSKSSNIKIQFYVDQQQREKLASGQKISAQSANGDSLFLIVRNIAVAADQGTRRFLIEAYPEKQGATTLLAGTILTVSVETASQPQNKSNFILPLSAISIGQNESYIFVTDNGIAKKIVVTVAKVDGETAEISSKLSPETLIITSGNKLVQEGETIEINN